MAKSKAKKTQKRNARRPRQRGRMGVRRELAEHINMLMDPCGAPLTKSVYGGAAGVITRHSTSGQIVTTTEQAAFFGWVPGAFRTVFAQTATGGTAGAFNYTAGNVPGYNFLNSTSQQARIVGACLQFHWNGSESSRAGSIAVGCVPASSVKAGVATSTIDQVFAVLGAKSRIPAGEVEIKWNPANEDESYSPCDSAITVDAFDDRNALYFAYEGPGGAALAWTLTCVVEWTPRINNGQPAAPTIRRSEPSAVSSINNFLHSVGHTADNLEKTAVNAMSTVRSVYNATSTGYRLLKGASRAVQMIGYV